MSAPLAIYRRALRLYPKAFRDEYGDDLLLLLADQLDDEPTWRVVGRSAVDLALTVPTRHLEARMNREPTGIVAFMFAMLALASIVIGRVVARGVGHRYVFLACSAVGIIAACLAVLTALRARALTTPVPVSTHWWKVLAAGVGLFVTVIVVAGSFDELPDNGWMVAMITGLTSFLLIASGLVLGIAHVVGRSARHAPA